MIPVITKEQAYKLDKDTIESGRLSQEQLMDNAGRAVAQFFCEKIDNYLLKSDMMKPWAFKTVVQLSKPI